VLMPAQFTRTLPHRILQALALGVGQHLMRTRLPDIDYGPARQMTRLNQIGSWHRIPPEECGSIPGRLLADLGPRAWPRLGTWGLRNAWVLPDLATRLVLLHETEQLLHGRPAKSVARRIAAQAQKTGGSARQTQHDAVAISDENMALGIVSGRDDFKLPTIERMGGIGYLDDDRSIAATVWVVEGGINIGYRSTRWIMPISERFCSNGCKTGFCFG